jgi:hypothetical protein
MVNRKIVNEFMETKKKHIAPRIEWIPLDNEISLALESTPPFGPDETNNAKSPGFFDTNHINLA